jgi:hypothetical protein
MHQMLFCFLLLVDFVVAAAVVCVPLTAAAPAPLPVSTAVLHVPLAISLPLRVMHPS